MTGSDWAGANEESIAKTNNGQPRMRGWPPEFARYRIKRFGGLLVALRADFAVRLCFDAARVLTFFTGFGGLVTAASVFVFLVSGDAS